MHIALGEFVPARFPIPQNPIIGVNGLGEFVPARFPIPQNPIRIGMGEFTPACFPVPQNPVGLSGMGGLGCGGGCGCKSCGTGMEGIFDDIQTSISSTIDSVTTSLGEVDYMKYAMYIGGAVVVYYLVSRGGGYRADAKALRSEYAEKSRKLKSDWGRGYSRGIKAYKAAKREL